MQILYLYSIFICVDQIMHNLLSHFFEIYTLKYRTLCYYFYVKCTNSYNNFKTIIHTFIFIRAEQSKN